MGIQLSQIQSKLDKAQKDLDNLKELSQKQNDLEKKEKIQSVYQETESKLQDLRRQIDGLSVLDTTQADLLEQEIEDLNKILSPYRSELDVLQQEVSSDQTVLQWDLQEQEQKESSTVSGNVLSHFRALFSKEEWGNNTRTNIVRAWITVGSGWGIYKIWKWIGRKLFWSKVENKDTESEKGSSRWGLGRKLLLGGLVASGLYTLVDRWLKGTWRWERLKGPTTENALKDIESSNKKFEKLDTAEQQSYNTYGNKVNEFYKEAYAFSDGSIPSDLDVVQLGEADLDRHPGVIPAALDGTFASVDDMISQRGLFAIDMSADITTVSKKIAGLVGQGAGWILGMIGFDTILDPAKAEEQIAAFLAGGNKLEQAKMVFRKILKVISYTQFAKHVAVAKAIEQGIAAGQKIYKLAPNRDEDPEQWEEVAYDPNDKVLLEKMARHPEEYKIGDVLVEDLTTQWTWYTLQELSAEITTYSSADIWKYNAETKEELDEINANRDAVHKALETNKVEALDELKENVEDQLGDSMWRSIQKGVPLLFLADMFTGTSREQKESLKKQAWFQDLVQKFGDEFEKLKSEEDITVIKKKVDAYYATLKEIALTECAVEDIVDENGNVGVRILSSVKSVFWWAVENIRYGFALIGEGDLWNMLTGGFFVATGVMPFYVVLRGKRIAIGASKAAAKLLTLLPAAVSRRSGYWLRNRMSGLVASRYDGLMLQDRFFRGKINTKTADNIVTHRRWKWQDSAKLYDSIYDYLNRTSYLTSSETRFLESAAKKVEDGGKARVYLDNTSLKKLLFKPKRKWWLEKIRRFEKMDPDAFAALKQLDTSIPVGSKKADLLQELIRRGHFTSVSDLQNLNTNLANLSDDVLKNVDIKWLRKALNKDMKILSSTDGLQKLVSTIETSIAPAENVKVMQRIKSVIDSDITKLRNDMTKANGNMKPVLQKQADELVDISSNLKNNVGSYKLIDLEVIETVYKSWLDEPKHVAAIIDAIRSEPRIASELVEGNTVLLKKTLNQLDITILGMKSMKYADLFAWNLDSAVIKVAKSFAAKSAVLKPLAGSVGGDALKLFGKFLKVVV